MDMTPARRATLAIGVPATLAIIGWVAFSLIATTGTGQYRFSTPVDVSSGTLTARVPGGNITVASGDQARMAGTLTYSLIRPNITVTDSSVSYRCRVPNGDCDMTGTLTVPATVTTLSVSTGGGDISVGDGITANVTLSTSGGNVSASGLSGTASLATGGGDIYASGVTASDVTARADGGNVTLKFTKVPHDVQVASGGGDISIVVPPGSYQFQATADGGSVSVPADSPGATDSVTATSSGGDVSISES
jgi:hypothetical protein